MDKISRIIIFDIKCTWKAHNPASPNEYSFHQLDVFGRKEIITKQLNSNLELSCLIDTDYHLIIGTKITITANNLKKSKLVLDI